MNRSLIRKKRLELGLTLDEVARACGTTRQNICRYEKGQVINIPQERIECLSKILKLTPAEIMGWDEDYISSIEKQIESEPTYADEVSGRLRKLTDEELKKVNNYISFIISERR